MNLNKPRRLKDRLLFAGAVATAVLVTASPRAASASMDIDDSVDGERKSVIDNPRGTMRNFDADNMGGVLTELGVAWQERQSGDGRPFVVASIGRTLSFSIYPSACLGDDGRTACVGAHYVALFKGVDANRQTVTAFNQAFPFTSAGITQAGSAYISRYEIADYGIARGNFASSLSSFLLLAERFKDDIATARKTVALDGTPEDMAARFLNRNGADAIGFSTSNADPNTAHQRAFDETVNIIRILEQQDGAPKNKITNVNQ